MFTVNFIDVELQKCYDSHLAEMDGLAQDLGQIRALIATSVLFRMLDGPHSVRVQEIMECLISPELRPALRSWYQRLATEKERLAMEFRNELNQLTGEQLEIPATISQTCLEPGKC